MELTESLKTLLVEMARSLKGPTRRIFMARTVKELGFGGQRLAERELGWCRVTIRKGLRELGEKPSDNELVARRGRMRAEERLPNLLTDLNAIVEQQRYASGGDEPRPAQLSAREIRRYLIAQKGYTDSELPTVQTIATKLKALGYDPLRGSRPRTSTKLHKGSGRM